ncbi:MAG: magnesium transporter [Lachnospiraceae bacterium]|nr:magnesium transporter [Candidatus Minthocola equi]
MIIDRMLLGKDDITVIVAVTVSLSIAVIVLVAKTIGCVIPMLAKKIGVDPAVISSPLLTTMVDALSLLIYFSIVQALLF